MGRSGNCFAAVAPVLIADREVVKAASHSLNIDSQLYTKRARARRARHTARRWGSKLSRKYWSIQYLCLLNT